LDGPGCSFFSRSRSAQSPSILFNIRFSNASAEAVEIPAFLKLPDLAAVAMHLNAHALDLGPNVFDIRWLVVPRWKMGSGSIRTK
jgi:hypothetical protein